MWQTVEKKVFLNKQPPIEKKTFNGIKFFPVYTGLANSLSAPLENKIPITSNNQCFCCVEYYKQLNLSPAELTKRLKNVSRHKDVERPSTPEHFWDIDFCDNI
jgi:hypothetical protein